MIILNIVIIIIPILLRIAFITLLERKFIGLSQFRKGPQKVGFLGILQPFRDALKLLRKEVVLIIQRNKKIYFFRPVLNFILVLILWLVLFSRIRASIKWVYLYLLVILGLGVYILFFYGWSSNNKYRVLGSIRGIAQSISYEISLALILYIKILRGLKIFIGFVFSIGRGLIIVYLPLSVLWVLVCVAETNRSPFDFSEGESELVRGFNTEYKGGLFTLIFLSEYGIILLLSTLSINLLFNVTCYTIFSEIFRIIFVVFWIWIRTRLPRFRYDKLIDFAWKIILPRVLLIINTFFLVLV